MSSRQQQPYLDAILRPGTPAAGILFSSQQVASEQFLFREPTHQAPTPSEDLSTLQGQPDATTPQYALVRLPDLRMSPSKVMVLQRWIGRVASVQNDRFVAVTTDATNPRNPEEEVEFDLLEVSESDRALVAEGAVFYWSIGYRDSHGGQRERISSLRFVRSPRLHASTVKQVFDRADRMAAVLHDSD